MVSLEDQLATSEPLTMDEIIEITKPDKVSEIEEIEESNTYQSGLIRIADAKIVLDKLESFF